MEAAFLDNPPVSFLSQLFHLKHLLCHMKHQLFHMTQFSACPFFDIF